MYTIATTDRNNIHDLIINNLSEGFCLIQMVMNDARQPVDFVVLEVNLSFEKLLGLKREQVLGKRAREFFPFIDVDWFEKVSKSINADEPVHIEQYYERTDRWLRIHAFSLNIMNQYIIFFSDITNHKKAEHQYELKKVEYLKEIELLESINHIGHATYHCKTEEEIGAFCLKSALEITRSKFGFIGLENQNGELNELCYDNLEPSATLEDSKLLPVDTLYERILQEGKGFYSIESNPAQSHVNIHEPVPSLLAVPLKEQEKTIGIVIVGNDEKANYCDSMLKSMEIFSDTMMQHLFRWRAKEEMVQNNQREELLFNLTSRLLASENPQEIIEDLCKTAMNFFDCDVFFNYMVEQGRLHLNACSGISEEVAKKMEWLDFGVASCGKVAQNGEHMIAENIPAIDGNDIELVRSLGVLAYAGYPLFFGNQVIGTLSFGSRMQNYFTEKQLSLMNTVSKHIAIALSRLIIHRALKQSEKNALALIKELQKADQAKTAFLNTLSHELRNPLATIQAGISLLGASANKEKSEKAKRIIQRQINQLCRLVDDLLDITRISNNKIELKKEEIELNALVLLAAEDYQLQFDMKGIQLEISTVPYALPLQADPARLTQIIGNLLHNALKFTCRGGKTQLAVYKDNNHAVIRVSDNGIGIIPELLPDLFTPFVQVENPHLKERDGLGLGLSIVKGVVLLHGGSISVNSDGLNQGSQFHISLPLNKEKGTESPAM